MYKLMILAAGLLTSTTAFGQAGPPIAYVKGSIKGDAIYLVYPDGTGLTKVYQAPRQGRFGSQIDRVTVKPNGGEVAFVQDSAHLMVQPFDSGGQPVGSGHEVTLTGGCSLYDPDYRSDGTLYVSEQCTGLPKVWTVAPNATTGTEWFTLASDIGALAALGTDLLYVEVQTGGPATLKRRTTANVTTTVGTASWSFPLYLDAAGNTAALSQAASFQTMNLTTGAATAGCTTGGMVKFSPTGSQMLYEYRNVLFVHNSDCSGAPFRIARGAKSAAWRSN